MATPWLQVYGRHAWHGARGEAQSAPRLHSFLCQGSSLAQDDRFCDTSLSTQRRAKHKMVAGCYVGCYVPQPCMNSLLPIGPRWARRRQTRPARERRVRLRECTAHSAQAHVRVREKLKSSSDGRGARMTRTPPKRTTLLNEAVSDPPYTG